MTCDEREVPPRLAMTGAVKWININVVINGADPCEMGVKQDTMSSRIEPALAGGFGEVMAMKKLKVLRLTKSQGRSRQSIDQHGAVTTKLSKQGALDKLTESVTSGPDDVQNSSQGDDLKISNPFWWW